jgi:hypothetical protein
MNSMLNNIIEDPSLIRSWVELLIFPKAVLLPLPHGHPAYSLGSRKRNKVENAFITENILNWKKGGVFRDDLVKSALGHTSLKAALSTEE